jgi:hypothetical protein
VATKKLAADGGEIGQVWMHLEHSVKCRSRLQHRHNSVIVIEDINSLALKLIMIFRNMRWSVIVGTGKCCEYIGNVVENVTDN